MGAPLAAWLIETQSSDATGEVLPVNGARRLVQPKDKSVTGFTKMAGAATPTGEASAEIEAASGQANGIGRVNTSDRRCDAYRVVPLSRPERRLHSRAATNQRIFPRPKGSPNMTSMPPRQEAPTRNAPPAPGSPRPPAVSTLQFRRSAERGLADHGWLKSKHTFSFADYYEPKWRGFRTLLVINEDRVAAGAGFPTHAHRDMEILSYVLEGALEHKDSMGTGSIIRPGDVQRMSAGTGVRHSEYNASKTEGVHFLQIWVLPSQNGAAPGYEQKTFAETEKRGRLRIVASPDASDGSITIHSNAQLYAGTFGDGEGATFEVKPGRHAWVHVAKGTVKVGGEPLSAGDAAYTSEAGTIAIDGEAGGTGEVLIFDLA